MDRPWETRRRSSVSAQESSQSDSKKGAYERYKARLRETDKEAKHRRKEEESRRLEEERRRYDVDDVSQRSASMRSSTSQRSGSSNGSREGSLANPISVVDSPPKVSPIVSALRRKPFSPVTTVPTKSKLEISRELRAKRLAKQQQQHQQPAVSQEEKARATQDLLSARRASVSKMEASSQAVATSPSKSAPSRTLQTPARSPQVRTPQTAPAYAKYGSPSVPTSIPNPPPRTTAKNPTSPNKFSFAGVSRKGPNDEQNRTTNQNIAGWSTLRLKKGKVDQYLANRSSTNSNASAGYQPIRIPSYDEQDDMASTSSSEEDDNSVAQSLVDVDSVYSVRVTVVSAVDFPASSIANQPLCPVLDLAVVPTADVNLRVNTPVRSTTCRPLSKRGAVEYHEEMRWNVAEPSDCSLAVQLSSRAVTAPANHRQSPRRKLQVSSSMPSIKAGEMEQAQAAAAVAQLLVKDEGPLYESKSATQRMLLQSVNSQEVDVKLRPRKGKRKRMTKTPRLAHRIIPLVSLPLHKLEKNETARLEQWFPLEMDERKDDARKPSVLLEISVNKTEAMDQSEDDVDEGLSDVRASFSKRTSLNMWNKLQKEAVVKQEEEPILKPGLVDFACVVGARDIGDQKSDDGSRGWVNSSPECALLEQFPPNDEYHTQHGRQVSLPQKIEWFCFPEGVKLWRGSTPPNADELNLLRFSSNSPVSMSPSTAIFDAYLGCTSSFSWFTMTSNSEEYGSDIVKTYGAVVRFYAPAPPGVDRTQDDFAQTDMTPEEIRLATDKTRLWVPIGICLTSSLPIIGVMESMLLRICESLGSKGISGGTSVMKELTQVITNYQKPIPGVVSCSIPFLQGDDLHVELPSVKSLPPLPHGSSVKSVCKLLGIEGFVSLLAAMLTECKILLHSNDVANLCMVGETMSAFIYPFKWSLPFVPVLPIDMMEVVEAPLSFLLGIPSCNLRFVDPNVLDDIVLLDLDLFADGESGVKKSNDFQTKQPTPLPASIVSSLTVAYNKLMSESDGETSPACTAPFPRLARESDHELSFRICVALEVCSLVAGLQDCLVYASSSAQPVFNVDKFLVTAPALFDEQRGTSGSTKRVVSPRSRRFLSQLITCQHFHQFLESLDSKSMFMYHEMMDALELKSIKRDVSLAGRLKSLEEDNAANKLSKTLRKIEEKITTFDVVRAEASDGKASDVSQEKSLVFPLQLLQQSASRKDIRSTTDDNSESVDGVKQVSLEFLVELDKNPWKYNEVLSFESFLQRNEPVKLRDALGDRKYRAWESRTQGRSEIDEVSLISDESRSRTSSLELTNLVTLTASGKDEQDSRSDSGSKEDRIEVAKGRDMLRRCLEKARVAGDVNAPVSPKQAGAADYIEEATAAMKRKAVRKYLLSILKRRNSAETNTEVSQRRRSTANTSSSRLAPRSFEVLDRLGGALLDACLIQKDYESAYAFLKLTAGLSASLVCNGETTVIYLTERVSLHPVFSCLGVWKMVRDSHKKARQNSRNGEEKTTSPDDQYEATISTLYEMVGYGICSEEMARFSTRSVEANRWTGTEKGEAILMLVRRLCIRRESNSGGARRLKDIELTEYSTTSGSTKSKEDESSWDDAWIQVRWCHPAAKAYRRQHVSDSRRPGTQHLLNMLDEQSGNKKRDHYMKRSAITAMATVNTTMVVTGALDGGLFLARQVTGPTGRSTDEDEKNEVKIKGLHLDWGSSGRISSTSTADGEYGVGAVSCLATTAVSHKASKFAASGVCDPLDEESLLHAVEGCNIIAGTTCGDLRVWNVRDVLKATFSGPSVASPPSSTGARPPSSSDYAPRSGLTRLKFSLRGRALSGHRGGVSCIDIPSPFFRPDSVITAGVDGLIKLWSLRPTVIDVSTTSKMLQSPSVDSPRSSKATRTSDALNILSGHGGRIMCIKSAWHGDRLLSGGADRSVRFWDLAAGRCLSSLSGHLGWVTHVRYWGSNTFVSASTDRSVALWDARDGTRPLCVLRHHQAPVSSLLVGYRTDPMIHSAAMDGSVASWDLRHLSSSTTHPVSRSPQSDYKLPKSTVSRGSVLLGYGQQGIYAVSDRTAQELRGNTVVQQVDVGHSDVVSCLQAMGTVKGPLQDENDVQGLLTASWDGTVTLNKRSMEGYSI